MTETLQSGHQLTEGTAAYVDGRSVPRVSRDSPRAETWEGLRRPTPSSVRPRRCPAPDANRVAPKISEPRCPRICLIRTRSKESKYEKGPD
jgi:hypothetical protein